VLKTTGSPPSILKRYGYGYDKAGNRTVEAIDATIASAAYDTRNRLFSQQAGGNLGFAGTSNEPATVTVGGQPASVDGTNLFAGSTNVPSGTSTVTIIAQDYAQPPNVRTNTYQVTLTGSGGSFIHDPNGNLTSDGQRTYEWDVEDRLVGVNHGSRRSEFRYNGGGQRVRVVEKDGATVLSDRRYLWCGLAICDERDAAGISVTRRFFRQGMQEGGAAYFYTRDHLGSVREMTDATGAVRARYDYDPFGRQAKVSGDKDAPFGFTGHFVHSPSALLLAPYRAYSPDLARWMSEDPIRPANGNLYPYVINNPVTYIDPHGDEAVLGAAVLGGTAPAWLGPALVIAGGAMAVKMAWDIGDNAAQALFPLPPLRPVPPSQPVAPPAVPAGPPPSTSGSGSATTSTPSNVVPFPGPKPRPSDCPAQPPEVITFPPPPPPGHAVCVRFRRTDAGCSYNCTSSSGNSWKEHTNGFFCPSFYITAGR
jgi:RHS repeat-associated protein